ncbi:uncharacterized protein LOC116432574 isoform X2 [Nomia melanderi]|uniref:uncharacterized protein LOC116432574 isoform X2 n=1 Tax=Nomia melanderi TaxID=2448451 RepID=UPI003FCDF3CD
MDWMDGWIFLDHPRRRDEPRPDDHIEERIGSVGVQARSSYVRASRDEGPGEISRPADRGDADGGRSAARASRQADRHRLQPEETHTGTGGTREESVRRPGPQRDHGAGAAAGLEVSRGEDSGLREEGSPAGAEHLRGDSAEGASPFESPGLPGFRRTLLIAKVSMKELATSDSRSVRQFEIDHWDLLRYRRDCLTRLRCSDLKDFARQLAHALNVEYCETVHPSPEIVVHKAEELVQEANRLRAKSANAEAQFASVQVDLRGCRDALDRAVADKEQLQRQVSSYLIDLDRLKQDKECLEMQHRVAERELSELRDKLVNANRSITNATGNISSQEALICQLRDESKQREEKLQRAQNDTRRILETLAVLLGGPNRFVESHENAIKDRVREILAENKDQALTIQNLREKVNTVTESTNRQSELIETTVSKIRRMEDERSHLESKIRKLESELSSCELSKDTLNRDKQTFVTFLDRLGKAMQMDEISEEMGLDLHTESLLVRAEQLARLETDKLVDKYSNRDCITLPRIQRERSFHEFPSARETSVVYQLQRRVRTLREQLQRRDLHLDLLRRKLSLQEDSVRMKSLLQTERDEANLRSKKLAKQIDRLQAQLSEEKIAALERSRKIEELQKRLVESEMLRTRCTRKLTMLKEQMRSATETAEQERSINDHSLQLLRDELAQVKQSLSEVTKRESQLQSFRVSVAKSLSEPICTADYEIISRLQKMVAAHRDFTMLSRRYDEPLDNTPSRCTSVHPMHPHGSPASRCTRYEDSGFADPPDLHDIEDEFAKRPVRSSLLP